MLEPCIASPVAPDLGVSNRRSAQVPCRWRIDVDADVAPATDRPIGVERSTQGECTPKRRLHELNIQTL
jgi:hypothetical protein